MEYCTAIVDTLRSSAPFIGSGWAWICDSAATTHQGSKRDTDAAVLKTKLSLDWIGQFKILAFDTPDNRTLHTANSYSATCLPTYTEVTPTAASPLFASILAGKSDDTDDMPNHLPSDLTPCVLNSFSINSPDPEDYGHS